MEFLEELGLALPTPEDYRPEKYFESCLRIGGRPILPPLMTDERRAECADWRRKAMVVEQRLEERRKRVSSSACSSDSEGQIQNENDEDEYETYEEDDGDEEEDEDGWTPEAIIHPPAVSASESDYMDMRSAFKSLIHRLRNQVPGPAVISEEDSSKSADSAASRLTVVENDVEDADDAAPPAARARSGSYTLTEPSPLLQAYVEMYGREENADMSATSRSSWQQSVKNRKALSPRERQKSLDTFLSGMTQMPALPPKEATPVLSHVPDSQCSKQLNGEGAPRMPTSLPSELAVGATTSCSAPDILISDGPKSEDKVQFVSSHRLGDGGTHLSDETHDDDRISSVVEDTEPVSIASSAANTVSISIDRPETEVKPDAEQCPRSPIRPSVEPAPSSASTLRPPSAATLRSDSRASTKQIEDAVSSLAQEQKARVQTLLEDQARQREELRRAFEEQQQALIAQIVGSIQGETFVAARPPLPFDLKRSASPVVPAAAARFRSMSTLPPEYSLPEEALRPEMHARLCRLSACAKGFLTRRLLRTDKVQSLVASMRDTMATALQLHREATTRGAGSISAQDVELHRHLLQQLNRDHQSLHDIFFRLGTAERMAVIALDHEIQAQKEERDRSRERRLSEARRLKQERQQRRESLLAQARHVAAEQLRLASPKGAPLVEDHTKTKASQTPKGRRSHSAARRSLLYGLGGDSTSRLLNNGKVRKRSASKAPWK